MKLTLALVFATLNACSSSSFSIDEEADETSTTIEDTLSESLSLDAQPSDAVDISDASPDTTPNPSETTATPDVATTTDTATSDDVASDDTTSDTIITPPTCALPVGSVATSATEYEPAKNAVDRIDTTRWNSGKSYGSISITFPSSIVFDRVRVKALAQPASNEHYVIESTAADRYVTSQVMSLEAFVVPRRARSSVKIDVSNVSTTGGSWITIYEVEVFDSTRCP